MDQGKVVVGLISLDEKYRCKIKELMDVLFCFTLVIYFAVGIGFNSMALALFTPRLFILAMAGIMALYMLREGINCLFVERYGWRDVLGLAICFLLGYIANRNDSAIPMCTYLTVFAARNIELKKTYKLMVAVTVITMGLIMWGASEGYIAQYLYTEKGHYRHSFGFNYTLAPPAYIMNIAMVLLAFRREKISWTEISLVFLFNALFYRWCIGDLSFGVTLVITVLMIVVKLWPEISTSEFFLFKLVDKVAVIIHPVCVAVSLWFTVYYDATVQWMAKFDAMLKGRLSLPHKAFNEYGVKLLGQRITMVGAGLGIDGKPVDQGGGYNYIDNLYINMLMRYGVLFCVVTLVLLVIMMVYCYKKKMRLWLWMLALYALHALLDDKMHLVYFNSLILIMGQAVQNLNFRRFRK